MERDIWLSRIIAPVQPLDDLKDVGGVERARRTLCAGFDVEELAEEATLAAALRFNPSNTAAGLEPAGPLNRLRRSSYTASQAARLDS